MPKSEKFQAPQRGRRRGKKVVSGFALLHHQHHQPGGPDRHLQRHHDLVGLLKQQLLKHSSALTLAYPTQVIGLFCMPLRHCHNTKSLQFFYCSHWRCSSRFADDNLCADFEFSGMVLPLCSLGKCPSSLPATSTARFAMFATSPLLSFLFSQITQPAFLKPLYFEVPRSSPSPLVGRAWLFREVTFVSIKSITYIQIMDLMIMSTTPMSNMFTHRPTK